MLDVTKAFDSVNHFSILFYNVCVTGVFLHSIMFSVNGAEICTLVSNGMMLKVGSVKEFKLRQK